MLIVNIAFYIIAIVALILGILAFTKKQNPGPRGPPGMGCAECIGEMEKNYATKPLGITVANAENLAGVDGKTFCQCQYQQFASTPGVFQMMQPNAGTLKPNAKSFGGGYGFLKFGDYCPEKSSKGACENEANVHPYGSWQAWPGKGSSFDVFNN